MEYQTKGSDSSRSLGFLRKIEIVGNKLPNPAILFLIMLGLLVVLSAILSSLHVMAIDPITKKQIVIKSLLSKDGLYWFLENMVQPDLPTGSLLFYNCRVLHSSMPNPQQTERPALLINYLDKNIMSEVRNLDNIWISNGTSS